MTVTVYACIQQISDEQHQPGGSLELREVEAVGATYLDAVDRAEAEVPDGWRVLYVSTESQQTRL